MWAKVKRRLVRGSASDDAPVAVAPVGELDPTDVAECPICGTVVPSFIPAGIKDMVDDRRCPKCTSLERHRAVWLYFQQRTNLFDDQLRMLHVAPEPAISPRLAELANLDYTTADLDPEMAMIQMDLMDIPYPDGHFDVVYASHVLEHVPDDSQAMREIHRVLSPDGWAVLLVPMYGLATREDPSVTDPAERERLYGQDDHVRLYGHDGEYERRLTAAGFDVTACVFAAELDPALVRRYRLLDKEIIHYCTKRDPAAAQA
jgi:SAM-dependent methyltransferase